MRRAALALGLATIAATWAIATVDAQAYDQYPCAEKFDHVTWTSDVVQFCPVTGLIDGRVPVYLHPIRHPKGAGGPKVASWLIPTNERVNGENVPGLRFRCQRRFPKAIHYHPNARWVNTWWALTVGADKQLGWVPEVYFKGGLNYEADLKLRICGTAPPAPPAPPSPPAPSRPCQTTPALAGVKLRAHFKHSRQVATPRYGSRPTVRGTLIAANGARMRGATVCVGVQDRADGPVTAVRSITTDAHGRFAYKLPVGVSRRVWFVHRAGGAAAAAHVDARVRAPVTMRSSRRVLRNGQATRFRGRVGGSADTRGLIVELQYPQRGGWQTFATTHVGSKGRFRYRYRFTRTFGTRTYRLRARVPAQRGYPFVAGRSRTVHVRVTG